MFETCRFIGAVLIRGGEIMWKRILIAVIGIFALVYQAASQSVRGAFPSPSIQIRR
jgi:type IV secretory pathway VirB2 component (pilin)